MNGSGTADARLQALLESTLTFEFLDGGVGEKPRMDVPAVANSYATVGQVQRVPFWIDLPGKPAIKIQPGEGYLIPPNIECGYSIRTTRPARFCWAHVNYFVFESLNLFHLVNCPFRFSAAQGRAIAAINRRLHALANNTSLSLKAIAEKKVLGYRLLAILLKSATRSSDEVG